MTRISDAQTVLKLLRYLAPHRLLVAGAVVFGILSMSLELAPPLVWKYGVDVGVIHQEWTVVPTVVAILAGIQILDAVTTIIRKRIVDRLILNFGDSLRRVVFRALLCLSYEQAGRQHSGELTQVYSGDIDLLQQAFVDGLDTYVTNLVRLVGIVGIFWWLQPVLGVATLLPVAAVGALLFTYSGGIRAFYRTARKKLGSLTRYVSDVVHGADVVRAFGRQTYVIGEHDRLNQDHLNTAIAVGERRAFFKPFVRGVAGFGNVIVYGLGAYLVFQGRLTVGGLVAFRGYSRYMAAPLEDLAAVGDLLQQAMPAAHRVFELLHDYETRDGESGAAELTALTGSLALRDVSYHYPERATNAVANLTLEFPAHCATAIVGESGAGKSTILRLITRFIEPTSGMIEIDGCDIATATEESLRRAIALVPQDPFLFDGSVRDNIRFGNPGADDELVIQVARAALAHEFILTLPEGYDTVVGERGTRLSGGQRQRIAVTRALIADAPILILDEATANIDPETERLIYDALSQYRHRKTIIVATHRLSRVRDFDRIVVLRDGRVAEQGTHEALIALDGQYARMVRAEMAVDSESTAYAAVRGR